MKRTFDVFVAFRHTRAGDVRIGVDDSQSMAMLRAKQECERAARDYDAVARTSVFAATLTLKGGALQPKEPGE